MQLKKEAFSGMVWVFIDYFLVKGVSFVGSIVLARLLMPSDFGIIAMIAIFMTFGNILLDSGLSSSLIRNNNNDDKDYSTVFFTNVFFGVIIYLFFFLTAPIIAEFFNQIILINIIRFYSIVFLLTSFSSVQMTVLIKYMQFKKIAVLNIPSVILGLGVGVFMAIKDYGVWSIISMYLVNQLILSLGLWLSSGWKPKFIFSKNRFLYHFNFGYRLLIANFLSGTTTNIYNAVTGKFYTLNTAGNFERAFTLNNYPLMVLTQVIGKVTFPLLSKIQDDKDYLNEIFIKLARFTFFVSAPLMIILSASAKPLILVLLGEKWNEAIPIFQILCLGGIFYTLQALNVNTIKIYGRTDYILKGEIFLNIVMIVLSGSALLLGFKVFLWSIVFNSFLRLIVNMFYCSKVIEITVMQQLISMFPVFVIASVTFVIIQLELNYFENYTNLSDIFKLVFSLLIGASSYLLLSYIFKISALLELVKFIKEKYI
ncbi:lipopolysaccharide biosynthesis protein [Empedobacter falsenii]|uniref:lipopolysaccharide biosynthesis protein n=1 Tax=Empedobacter falsenii TaxID=343874 RepID=UPI003A80543A